MLNEAYLFSNLTSIAHGINYIYHTTDLTDREQGKMTNSMFMYVYSYIRKYPLLGYFIGMLTHICSCLGLGGGMPVQNTVGQGVTSNAFLLPLNHM